MGNFGERVSALLDTYTRCLALLKGFNKSSGKRSSGASDAAELSSSIREAKSKVARSYTSKADRKGESFERGDAVARSSLKKVIAKLTSALSDLGLRLSRNKRDVVDFRSLTSLSRASQLEALQTMTDLSRRIGSKSSLRVSEASRTSRSQRSTKSRASSSKTSKSIATTSSRRLSKDDRRRSRHHSSSRPLSRRETRYSDLTMSSNSTKIGEIRRRDRHHHQAKVVAYPRGIDLDKAIPTQPKKKWWPEWL